MKIDTSFSHIPVEFWNDSKSYCYAKKLISAICVVNDAAERGVKLCHDFLNLSKKENNLQNILQVVEKARRETPNQRKRKLQSIN